MRSQTPLSHDAAPDADLVRLAGKFPKSFVWGVATSSFQIEGATGEDGRLPSIWDEFCRRPGAIKDGSNGEPACDHYHRFSADVDLISDLNIPAYRFSVAWPRVQPLGVGAWNEPGFAFYDRLIDRLLARGIAPHLTLYHWDLPQALQESGGWTSRDTVRRFVDYAAEVARRFGDRVASIATHNEPWVVSILGHEAGIFAPGQRSQRAAMAVSHHLLLSHGLALQAMRAAGVPAPLGIVLNHSPIHPATESAEDLAKARLDDGLTVRWYMDPLLTGRYPADVLEFLGADAPPVFGEDMAQIRQPLDFLGVNYYTRNVSGTGAPKDPVHSGREVTDMGWEVFPEGLSELLVRLHEDYRLPPVYIMENGAAYPDRVRDGRVDDPDRVRYLASHIESVATAMSKGVDVRGYFVWSLFDNFEWADGYTKRFGIVYIDYETQRRIPKQSALWYQRFLAFARDRSAKSTA